MLSRSEYQEFLRPFACQFITEAAEDQLQDGLYGWAYWRTSWGFNFFVPEQGPDKACPEHRFFEILSEISLRARRT
jgi:hypothetical protein